MVNRFFRGVGFASFVLLAGCGGSSSSDSSSNPVTGSLVNGYQLTGSMSEVPGESGLLDVSAVITYDQETNTSEWVTYDYAGAAIYRDVGTFNEQGRLIESVEYLGTGEWERTTNYTIESGLITQRTSSTGETLKLTYTNNNVLSTHEYSDAVTGEIRLLTEYSHNSDGRIVSADDTFYQYDDNAQSILSTRSRTFEYNNLGQLIWKRYFDGDNSRTEQYTYDEFGNNIQQIIRNDDDVVITKTTYTYSPSVSSAINYRLRIVRFFL